MPQWPPFPQSNRLVTLSPPRPFCAPTTPISPPIPNPPQPAPHVPHVQPSGPSAASPHRCQGCQELTSIVRRLTFQLQALQTELPPQLAHLPPPALAAPLPFYTTLVPQLGLFPPPPVLTPLPFLSLPLTLFVLAPVVALSCPPLCTTGYCDIHCHSHRCHFHHPSSSAHPTHPPYTPSVRSGNPPRRFLAVQLVALLPHTTAAQWAFALPTTSRRCHRRTPPSPMQPHCRSGCVEPAPPGCPVGFCNLHCTSPRCVVHDPLSQSGNGQGGGGVADGGRRREPLLCRSLLWFGAVQLSSSLGRDGAVHDGFMGLVSCLDQLDLRVLCVQETQSPLMGTLPTDQPFRYDGPDGSYGREAGFLLHPSIISSPIPGIADLQSLRWRLVSGVVCVCSFYAPHVGIAVDARVEFWRTLAGSVHRVSHPPRVADVARCRRLQCVASSFPARSVTTS